MATAAVTNTFINATVADADEVNANFADLVSFLNNSVVHRDGSKSLTGNLSAGSNKITNLALPTADGDAASKSYVDGVGAMWGAYITRATSQTGMTSGTAIDWTLQVEDDGSYYNGDDQFTIPSTRNGMWHMIVGEVKFASKFYAQAEIRKNGSAVATSAVRGDVSPLVPVVQVSWLGKAATADVFTLHASAANDGTVPPFSISSAWFAIASF